MPKRSDQAIAWQEDCYALMEQQPVERCADWHKVFLMEVRGEDSHGHSMARRSVRGRQIQEGHWMMRRALNEARRSVTDWVPIPTMGTMTTKGGF